MSNAIAALFNLGSLTHQAPQVNLAHTIPVNSPSIPKRIPAYANSEAKVSLMGFELFKNLIEYTIETVTSIIMANHIGTWKY